ncbi:hypothetical protein ACFVW8_38165 [Streptomyces sp. NPDC058221]|uniref:hypothetical protein n=1 Tax=Streptomyces sp. NPDC058221 TaxID=3346388 RepID=UPI0036E25906
MLISNALGPRGLSRRGHVLAAAVTVLLCAGVAPAAAGGASPGQLAGDSAGTADVRGGPVEVPPSPTAAASTPGTATGSVLDADGDAPAAQRLRASTGPRTLVPAVIGSAVGLAVFVGGGLMAAARRRNGYGRR